MKFKDMKEFLDDYNDKNEDVLGRPKISLCSWRPVGVGLKPDEMEWTTLESWEAEEIDNNSDMKGGKAR